jgi:hypothetical protein
MGESAGQRKRMADPEWVVEQLTKKEEEMVALERSQEMAPPEVTEVQFSKQLVSIERLGQRMAAIAPEDEREPQR